jgi:hypothetical protein
MGWPQITFICLSALTGLGMLQVHGKDRPPYNFYDWLINAAITFCLLGCGGFFNDGI